MFSQTATALVTAVQLSAVSRLFPRHLLVCYQLLSLGAKPPGGLMCCVVSALLCVGVESPSHAIRADADPLARSATSVVITLADKYTYDCPVSILIYPSGRWTASNLPHSTVIM